MLLKAFRWLLGHVSFKVSGGCPEKFINLLRKENIDLLSIRKSSGILYGDIIASEYKSLRPLAKKSNCRLRLISKRGLPFFIFKYRKRWGIVVGMLVFISIIYCFSMYIWDIKVVGNEEISVSEVVQVMEELGLSSGSLKSRINTKMIEQMAMMRFDNIAWMSVNMHGSCAEIAIKEKIKKPDIPNSGEPCNIVANEDGQIERFETYCGNPVVNVGDVVTRGQLLVSGIMEDADYNNMFLSAECRVFAKTKKHLSEKIPMNILKAVDTGKVIKKYRIKIFGFEVPIGLWSKTDDTFRYEISLNDLKLLNVRLPVKIYTENWYQQECAEIQLSVEQACEEARKNMSQREIEEFSGMQILEKSVVEKEENGDFILESDLICLEDIGRKEKIMFE